MIEEPSRSNSKGEDPNIIDVFISYKREERRYADLVEDALKAKGYRVVSDRQIGPSESFADAIDRLIQSARCVLVLWTPAANSSSWVKSEAAMAVKLKTYLGVLVEPVELRVDFSALHCTDLQHFGLPDGISLVVDDVRGFIGEPSVTAAEAETQSADDRDEMIYFVALEIAGSQRAYEAYLRAYPEGRFRELAEQKIQMAKAEQAAQQNLLARIRRRLPSIAALTLIVMATGTAAAWYGEFRKAEQPGVEPSQVAKLKGEVQAAKKDLQDAETKSARLQSLISQLTADNSELKLAQTDLHRTADAQVTEIERLSKSLRLAEALREEERPIQAGLLDQIRTEKTADAPPHARAPGFAKSKPDCKSGVMDGFLILGICYPHNTSSIDLRNTELDDLAPISNLIDLRILYLSRTQISDLSPLTNLKSLRVLHINNTRIENLSPITNIDKLQTLDISGSAITDIAPISRLNALENLSLDDTQISDISPISSLKKLRTLSLSNTKQINDFSPLSNLRALETLTANETKINDLSLISGLTELRSLSIASANQIKDFSPLSKLTKLRSLLAINTKIKDLSSLSSLHFLERLFLNSTAVDNLSPLSSIATLSKLAISRTPVTDLSPLSGLTLLQELNLSLTQITNLSALSDLGTLSELDIGGTAVVDLSPLSKLTSLKELNLLHLPVTDLSPLLPLTALHFLLSPDAKYIGVRSGGLLNGDWNRKAVSDYIAAHSG